MRTVVVLGKGLNAIRCAQWVDQSPNHRLVAAVPVNPEPPWVPSFGAWAVDRGLPVVISGDHADLHLAFGGDPDLAISVLYDRILPRVFLRRCGRVVNLHYSLLPTYRGTSPVNWALKNNETTHGVTVHDVTPGIDDGPILSQASFSIFPEFDEVSDVYERCNEYGWLLLKDTLANLDQITPVPQNHEHATYYGNVDRPRLGDRRYLVRTQNLNVEKRA